MALRTLLDCPVLAPLALAARRADVDIVLFGSVVARAMLLDAAGVEPRDLFELTEHLADIDLGHTGPPSVTPLLQQAIAEVVPMAPWFRWSLVDGDGLSRLDQLRPFNVSVPLRGLCLGTQAVSDGDDTAELLKRALNGEIEILPNEMFSASPRSSYDTEASALLLYIDATLDVIEVQQRSGRKPRILRSAQARGLVDAGIARLGALTQAGREVALRRLWYRLSAIAFRASPKLFNVAVEAFGLDALLETMHSAGYPVFSFGREAGAVVMVSAHLGDGLFRVPHSTDGGFGDWREPLNEVLGGASRSVSLESTPLEPIELGPGNDVIAAIRSIPVHSGISHSSIVEGPLAQEFVHIGLPASTSELCGTTADRLTAIVIGYGIEGPWVVPAPASVSTALVLPHELLCPARCTIRLNLAGMLDGLDKLDVFLVKADWE